MFIQNWKLNPCKVLFSTEHRKDFHDALSLVGLVPPPLFFFLEFNFHEYKSYKSYTNIWTIIKYVITTIIRVSDTVSLEKELPFQPFSTRFYKPSDNAYWSTYMYNNAFGKLQRWSFSLSQRCCSRTYQHNMLNHSLAANYDNRKLLSSS